MSVDYCNIRAGIIPPPPPPTSKLTIIVLEMENTSYNDLNATVTPYLWNNVKPASAWCTNYREFTGNSLPCYFEWFFGFRPYEGATADNNPPDNLVGPGTGFPNSLCLVDLLEQKGLAWKAYAQDYAGGNTAALANPPYYDDNDYYGGSFTYALQYYTHHNPFIYSTTVCPRPNNPVVSTRPRNIVPSGINGSGHAGESGLSGFNNGFSTLITDLNGSTPPNFGLVVPGFKNDGHDPGYRIFTDGSLVPDTFLSYAIPGILATKTFTDRNGILFLIWDESHGDVSNIPGAVIGPRAINGTYATQFTHYSLLRTIENQFGLGTLTGNDAGSNDMSALISSS